MCMPWISMSCRRARGFEAPSRTRAADVPSGGPISRPVCNIDLQKNKFGLEEFRDQPWPAVAVCRVPHRSPTIRRFNRILVVRSSLGSSSVSRFPHYLKVGAIFEKVPKLSTKPEDARAGIICPVRVHCRNRGTLPRAFPMRLISNTV